MGRVGEGERIHFRWSVAAGAAMSIVTLIQSLAIHARSCGALPRSYDVVVAFELTRTPADLAAIFGTAGSDCRSALLSHLWTLTWLDSVLLVPLYASFLWCFLLAYRRTAARLARLASSLVVLAACADWTENCCLFAIMPAVSGDGLAFALLPWATSSKWFALGACNALGGWLCFRDTPRILAARLAATLGVSCFTISVGAIGAPPRFGSFLVAAVGSSWLTFLVIATKRAFPKRALA